MSNLAVKIQERRQEEKKHAKQTLVVKRKRSSITLSEKLLFVVFLFLMLVCSIWIISNSVKLYQANIEMQKIEAKIENQEKINSDLNLQVDELKRPERIYKIAKDLGFTLDPSKVKGIQD